jgi:Transcriptional regulators
MERARIGVELRALTNSIRRYFEFSTHRKEIQNTTGNNKLILNFLSQNQGRDIYQKDVEAHFNIARSTASKVLNLMEEKGLIRRLSVSHDARLKRIVLTEQALEIQSLMREDADKMEEKLTRGFTDTELALLHSYVMRMRENMSSQA